MDTPEFDTPKQYARLFLFTFSRAADISLRLQRPLPIPNLPDELLRIQPLLPIPELIDLSPENYFGIPVLLQFDISGRFILPGGKLEVGEDPEDCLIREMRQEHKRLGFDVWTLILDRTLFNVSAWSTNSYNTDYAFIMMVAGTEDNYFIPSDRDTLRITWADYLTCLHFFQTKQMPQNIWELIKQGYESLRL